MTSAQISRQLVAKLKAGEITAFQYRVYDFICKIPKGKTMTYQQVAKGLKIPKAARAVGNALNRNPLAPDVPCHRVVRSDGSIGGFASGPKKKAALLIKEGAIT